MRFLPSILLLLALTLSACDVSQTTVPADTSASALDARVIIADGRDSDHAAGVVVFLSSNGTPLQLTNNESVSCNGVILPSQGPGDGFGARVPVPLLTTRVYDIVYHHGSVDEHFLWTVRIEDIPALRSPAEGQSVPRSSALMITYMPAYGSGWTIGATAATGNTTVTSTGTIPDQGSVVVDTSTLPVGPGYIALTRAVDSDASNTPFHSLHISYTITSRRFGVTWT